VEFSLDDLRRVGDLIRRKRQIENWKKEISDRIETLERQKASAAEEMAVIQGQLDGKYAGLVEAASEFASKAGITAENQPVFTVYNPKHVTNDDKDKLLKIILDDFKAENPKTENMTFQQVRAVLESRYGVETRTIGNFFRRQLPNYETAGGNKKKMIVLKVSSERP